VNDTTGTSAWKMLAAEISSSTLQAVTETIPLAEANTS